MKNTRWTEPDPAELPKWRGEMIDYQASDRGKATMREAIHAGQFTLLPMVPGMNATPGSIGSALLTRSEEDRLRRARLYYASSDMTALTLAASRTVPTEPVSMSRPPSPYGLIVFADPIGGYDQDAAKALLGTPAYLPGASAVVTTPIVAASWSPWSTRSITLDGDSGHGIRWLYKKGGRNSFLPDGFTGIWVTFYSPRGLFSGLAPDTPIGRMGDGRIMTARHIDRERDHGGPVLGWDNEMVMKAGGRFEEPEPDTSASWTIALYTAWQLMTQTTRTQWVETEDIPRSRSGIKRDARQGITEPGGVRILRVHSSHRPTRKAAQEDAAASSGRREPRFSCRWPVAPYRRDTCLNTRAHAGGGCTHEDRIVPGHVKGPAGAPLRVRETVRLWDQQA